MRGRRCREKNLATKWMDSVFVVKRHNRNHKTAVFMLIWWIYRRTLPGRSVNNHDRVLISIKYKRITICFHSPPRIFQTDNRGSL